MDTLNEINEQVEKAWRELADEIAQQMQKEAEKLAKALAEFKRLQRERQKRK